MHKFFALISLLLSFAGCDPNVHSISTRTTENGHTLIDSKVIVHEQVASFQCVDSSSGQCHYALFRDDCIATQASACNETPFQQISMPRGSEQALTGLPTGFVLCVSQDDARMTSSCLHPSAGTASSGGGQG